MNSFTINIDRDKCNDCGVCVYNCISGALYMVEGRVEVRDPSWCIRDSHCVAVCPEGAIIHGGLSGQDPIVLDGYAPDPEALGLIIKSRRSIKHYKHEQVPRELIQEVLNVANYYLSASGNLDVGYSVVTDRELINKYARKIWGVFDYLASLLDKPLGQAIFKVLKVVTRDEQLAGHVENFHVHREWVAEGRDLIALGAPVVVFVHGPKKGHFNAETCALAAANAILYAHAKGLGTSFLGFFLGAMGILPKMAREMGIPRGRRAYMAFSLGWPDEEYKNTAIRPLADVNWV